MEKNKTGKYLKYAIGEIILVVIGILIALQINNWNSERLANAKMTTYLHNLKEDLVSDTLAFNNAIGFYKYVIDYKTKLLSLSQYENISTDSLSFIITPHYSNYDLNTTTFTKIKNLGISKLSKNDSLSKKIYNYYTTRKKIFNTIINWEVESTNNEGNYWYSSQNEFEIKHSNDFPHFQDKNENRQNLIKLISEPKGRNNLLFDFQRKQRVLREYEKMRLIAIELISKIQNDLTVR
ncbi:hypothetical protein IMCC3317_14050 [Kordia antarctica]|uniref:Uncharacterized protein n=1 Tax=Kordia antarctica TaxID=1218801 RepID=A0A7L4ZHE2_9FLAO|nr:DUF6090 family protein [Kordia antarctica]QHI36052.1 hypothetical protein IMCC3317_14050 [Kordia antarctica]